jgi:thioredoxin-related protein
MKFVLSFLVVLFSVSLSAQDMKTFKAYHPEENAEEKINEAAAKAKASGKQVMLQIGGNWCIWCARFIDFVANDKQLDSAMNANYVVYKMNYSKENYNAKLLAKYNYPQRFGFPVFLVLDGDGKLLHTQNSWYLEADKSYSKEKVMAFLNEWNLKSFDPSQYREQ